MIINDQYLATRTDRGYYQIILYRRYPSGCKAVGYYGDSKALIRGLKGRGINLSNATEISIHAEFDTLTTASALETLEQAKAHVEQGLSVGIECPCCGQLAKLYKRKIYATPAAELIALFRLDSTHDPDQFYHISNFRNLHGGDISKLRYWGLVEERTNEDDTKRTSGYWRITDKGRRFALGKITVPKYAYIYNSELHGFSEQHQSIIDALGEKFNYPELMGCLL